MEIVLIGIGAVALEITGMLLWGYLWHKLFK